MKAVGGAEALQDEGGGIDKLLEELNATFAYVSDFLKQVPEQTRTKSIFWSRMESYKKDQDVYLKGEEPGKFYMILTGGAIQQGLSRCRQEGDPDPDPLPCPERVLPG